MKALLRLITLLACSVLNAEAGQIQATGDNRLPGFGGPAAPAPPATINRDAEGRATVRAVRIETPLTIDGRLDEAIYREMAPITDFIQNDPKEGAPASEKTDVWLFYDRDNFYVVGRCWESHPETLVANEMRRDNVSIVQDDQFAWGLDTCLDRRNMLIFEVSASGGRIDGQVTNERQVNLDWNPIWDVRTSRFEGGYIVEAAIPFKSLRYRQGSAQVWGLQVRRHNMAKNEYSYLTPIPAYVGSQGLSERPWQQPSLGSKHRRDSRTSTSSRTPGRT
jgi:hypothetical protein